MKRIFDIALSIFGLCMAAPIMLAIALILYIDSPGPVFFRQKRVGKNRTEFWLYKFRKFPMDCKSGPCVTVSNDVRMTSVGRVLERTKLDELPQLWNILKGDMSFVGPRPESTSLAHLFQGEYIRVLDFTPGLFGPNQIHFRNESRLYPADMDPEQFYNEFLFPQKAKADIEYFSQTNFLKDLWLIVRGAWVTLAGIADWKALFKLHIPMLLADVICVIAAWAFANAFVLGGIPYTKDIPPLLIRTVQSDWALFSTGLCVLPPWVLASLWIGGVYRFSPHFGLSEGISLTRVVFGSLFVVFFLLIGLHFRSASFVVVTLFFASLLALMLCTRLQVRIRLDKRLHKKIAEGKIPSKTRILIYGAGKVGQSLLQWTKMKMHGVEVVGFIDDQDSMQGCTIQGCKVLGKERDIPNICDMHGVSEIWMSYMPRENKLQRLKGTCMRTSVTLHNILDNEPFCRFIPYG